MKKWLLIFSAVVVLSACNESANQQNETKGGLLKNEEDPVKVTEEKEEDVEKEGKDTEETVDKAPLPEVTSEEREPQYELNENTWTIEPISEEITKNVVLLTIDDAPDKHALKMAQTLKKLNVKAIFFINGHFVDTEEEKEILKAIHNLGFSIGNHTMTHSNLKNLTEENQREEILTLSDQIEQITGERPRFFRAPFGQNTDYVRELVAQEGMLLMNWTYGYDWEKDYQSKEALVDIMVNTPLLRPGANLLMHDREWTNAGLEEIVKGIQSKGYNFVDPALIKPVN